MQTVNSLTFNSITYQPLVGDVLTNGAVVIRVNGACIMCNVVSDFTVGTVVTGSQIIGTISEVYSQQIYTANDILIAQYANSPIIAQMTQSLLDAVNMFESIDDFYNDVWNIDTAKGYGLSIWGKIVNVSNVIQIPTNAGYAGFHEAGIHAHSFGMAPFYNGALSTTGYVLTDDAYRILIMGKAGANITNSSIKALNAILMAMFPNRGNIYVQTVGLMQMNIVVSFPLTPAELSILKNGNVVPVPTGVQMNVLSTAFTGVVQFGEAGTGTGHPTFGYGSFFRGFL